MLSTHYYLLLPGVCSSLSSVHCAVRLQNGSLSVLKYFSGKGGDQSGHLESLGGTSPDILILGGTSQDTLTFSENIYLPSANERQVNGCIEVARGWNKLPGCFSLDIYLHQRATFTSPATDQGGTLEVETKRIP